MKKWNWPNSELKTIWKTIGPLVIQNKQAPTIAGTLSCTNLRTMGKSKTSSGQTVAHGWLPVAVIKLWISTTWLSQDWIATTSPWISSSRASIQLKLSIRTSSNSRTKLKNLIGDNLESCSCRQTTSCSM